MNIITKIEVQKNNKNRVNIYIDNEFSFACEAELVYKHNLKVKDAVSLDELKDLSEEEGYSKAKSTALKYIERSFKTESEVMTKLKDKGYSDNTISRVILFLKEYSFVDDNKYVELYVKENGTKMGAQKIKYNLYKKGIKRELIDNALSDVDKDVQYDSAYNLAEKKLVIIQKRETDNRKLYQKLSSYLMRNGYNAEISYRICSELIKKSYD